MRTAALAALVLCACTKQPAPTRERPAARVELDAPPASPIDAGIAAPDVPPAETEHSIASPSCNNAEELGAGLETARDAGADWFSCRTDAGVQLRLALGVPEGTRPLWLATILQRAASAFSPARRREEMALMERDARSLPDRFASAELALRNPQRTIGRLAAVRGTVISAQESGVTALLVGIGPLEITPIDVVYPALAEEWVVAGARVRIGGVWGERDGKPVLFASIIERR